MICNGPRIMVAIKEDQNENTVISNTRHGALTAIFMCTTSTVADSSLQGARMRATCIGSEIGLEIEKGDLGIAVRR